MACMSAYTVCVHVSVCEVCACMCVCVCVCVCMRVHVSVHVCEYVVIMLFPIN